MESSDNFRIKPKQERAKNTVSIIKQITMDLLAKHHYQAITTNHIAKEANISIGSLYKYFPNKEALFLDIAKDLIKQSSQIIKESVRLHHEKSAKDLFMVQMSELVLLFNSQNSNLSFIIPMALKDRSVYRLIIEQLSDSILLYVAFNKDKYSTKNPPLTARLVSMAVVAIVIGYLEIEDSDLDLGFDLKSDLNADPDYGLQEIGRLIDTMLKG